MDKKILLFSFLVIIPSVYAHEEAMSLPQKIPNPLIILGLGIVCCAVFLMLVLFKKNWKNNEKRIIFWTFAVIISAVTFYFLFYTLLVNFTAETNGPVHWHADFEIWICGEKQILPHSKGISGRVGTPLMHYHDDDRMHVEGTVMNTADVNLGNFFASIGGALADTYIGIPQNDGSIEYWHTGDKCPDGHIGTLALYVTKAQSLTTVENIAEYVISPETNVPPGDQLKLVFN